MHQAVDPKFPPFSEDMSLRRSMSIEIVFVMLSLLLSPHWFFPLLVAYVGREVTIFYSRLADPLSVKNDLSYNKTLSWMRCVLSCYLSINSIEC